MFILVFVARKFLSFVPRLFSFCFFFFLPSHLLSVFLIFDPLLIFCNFNLFLPPHAIVFSFLCLSLVLLYSCFSIFPIRFASVSSHCHCHCFSVSISRNPGLAHTEFCWAPSCNSMQPCCWIPGVNPCFYVTLHTESLAYGRSPIRNLTESLKYSANYNPLHK